MAFNRVLQPTGGTDVTNNDGRPGGEASYDDVLPGQTRVLQISGGVLEDLSYVEPDFVPIGLSGDYLTRDIFTLLFPGGYDLGGGEEGDPVNSLQDELSGESLYDELSGEILVDELMGA